MKLNPLGILFWVAVVTLVTLAFGAAWGLVALFGALLVNALINAL